MDASSIFQVLDDIIRFDHFNIQEIRESFEKDLDFSPLNNEIIRYEAYDGRTDAYIKFEEPHRITFETFLKWELSSEVDRVFKIIEEENASLSAQADNILFLTTCLAKADILLMRTELVSSNYSTIFDEVVRKFSNQLHKRFDTELEFKIRTHASDPEISLSKILLELQKKNEVELSKTTIEKSNPKLKFNLNRNQITILFLLLAQNKGLNPATKPADLAKFLETNCLYWNGKKKDYIPVTDVATLISDFKHTEKLTDAPLKWVKSFFKDAKLTF